MEERVGAYIIDSEGNLIPDLNDEAMAKRAGDKPTPNPSQEGKSESKMEVKNV